MEKCCFASIQTDLFSPPPALGLATEQEKTLFAGLWCVLGIPHCPLPRDTHAHPAEFAQLLSERTRDPGARPMETGMQPLGAMRTCCELL